MMTVTLCRDCICDGTKMKVGDVVELHDAPASQMIRFGWAEAVSDEKKKPKKAKD